MIKKLFVISSLFLMQPVFGATFNITVPDAQVPYIQNIVDKQNVANAAIVQPVGTVQPVITVQEYLQELKDMLQALSPSAQLELATALQAKAVLEGLVP